MTEMHKDSSRNVTGSVENKKILLYTSLATVGGSIVLLSVIAAPFLIVPASKKLGSLPWMATPQHVIHRALSEVQRIDKARGKQSILKPHSPIWKTLYPQQQRPRLLDLGCGDGRVCITAVRDYHYEAVGLELNPVLIALSYYRAWRANYSQQNDNEDNESVKTGSTPNNHTGEYIGTLPMVSSQSTRYQRASNILSYLSFRQTNFWHESFVHHQYQVVTVFGVRSIMQRLEEKLLNSVDVSLRQHQQHGEEEPSPLRVQPLRKCETVNDVSSTRFAQGIIVSDSNETDTRHHSDHSATTISTDTIAHNSRSPSVSETAVLCEKSMYVVCYRFPLPNITPIYTKDELFIYLL